MLQNVSFWVILVFGGILRHTATAAPFAASNTNSTCRGEVMSISELNLLFIDTPQQTLGNLWCYSEILRYRNPTYVDPNGFGPHEGYICMNVVRRATETPSEFAERLQKDLIARDAEAHAAYRKFGGDFGYLETGPVYRNRALITDPNVQFGTGLSSLQDLPLNMCATLMREMLCHVAFPQGVGDPMARAIRPVCYSSCEHLFHLCNRKQPSKAELEPTYVSQELLETLKTYEEEGLSVPDDAPFQTGLPLRSNYYCMVWNWGWGAIPPFTVSAISPQSNDTDCVPYSATHRPPFIDFAAILSITLVLIYL